MTDKQLMLNVVKLMLEPDNTTRSNAEQKIKEIAISNPDKFTQLNLEIIKDDVIPNNLRMSSIIILKNNLKIGENKPCLYLKLSDQVLENFKKEIIIMLSTITNIFIVKKVANLISDLAASIFNAKNELLKDNQRWPNLIQYIFELYKTKKFNSIIASLTVLEGLFDQTGNKLVYFKNGFVELFTDGFSNENLEIKLATTNCLLSLVLMFKPKELKFFKIFNENVLQIIMILLDKKKEDSLNSIIGRVFDICQYVPSFFKKKFDELLIVMSRVREFDDEVNSNLKTQSIEPIIYLLDCYPELIENNIEKLTLLVELIFKNMIEIEDEIEDEWKSPPDGFNDDIEDCDDQKTIKLGMDFIDRLILIVGEEKMIPFLSNYIKKMLNDQNWKMKHAAIMTISQLGEYLEENIKEVENLVKIIGENSLSTNPRIRYACCHSLGQFSDDLSPDFQDNFHEMFFKISLPMLKDNVPRVVAHCMAAMTNFLEHSTPKQISPHFNYIYEKIQFWLQNGITFVKEACLNVLSALAEGSGELFNPYYDQSMNILLSIFSADKKKEFKKLKGSAIESITIIGKFFGKARFLPYAKHLIPELIKIQTNQLDLDESDPQKSYLLGGWNRICTTLEKDFAPYINDLMPSLLMLSKSVFKNQGKSKTYDTEESEVSIKLINLLMKYYPEHLISFIEPIYEIIVFINKCNVNKDTKSIAVNCLPGLIKVAKYDKSKNITILGKNIFAELWKMFVEEEDSIYKGEYCFILQKIIDSSGAIFEKNELIGFFKKCEEELKKSDKRRMEILDSFDLEEETKENLTLNLKCENQFEDEFKLEIANLFGKIFKTHKENSLEFFNVIYENHIIASLQNDKNSINIQYGLYLSCDSVEYLGTFLNENLIKKFYDIFLNFCLNVNLDIRQIASYGLSVICVLLGNNFNPLFENTLKIIVNSIEIAKLENQKKEKYILCRESSVVTLGKLLQINWENIDQEKKEVYISYWIKYLPIYYDYKKGIKSHKMMIHILMNDPNIILGKNNQNLKKIFMILFKIYKRRRLSEPNLDLNIEKIISVFMKDENIKSCLSKIDLKEEHELFIKIILENDKITNK